MSDQTSKKPDLDEVTNVNAEAAAAARENHMLTEGAEPLSLWVILGGAIVVLIGGGVLFGGGVFDFENFAKKDYVRANVPGADGSGPAPKSAMVAYKAVGAKLYGNCAACHQASGAGNPGIPPLADSEWVTGPSLKPALIILNGMKGPVTVKGQPYNGNMAAIGASYDAVQLAGVLNYIRNSFGNSTDELITVEMAEYALKVSQERGGGQVTAAELEEKYARDLEGASLDPETLVDPKTLQPVAN